MRAQILSDNYNEKGKAEHIYGCFYIPPQKFDEYKTVPK